MILYNEIEPYAVDWLANLSVAGHIASGAVDRRSIHDLAPEDVRDLIQFHAFAGIGVWSYALRRAGWPDDVSVWTGSCPCQPFSSAGRRRGTADERHLWPEWFRLIRECRPVAIFGEQVASPDGLAWFDAVSTDLEGEGYAVGAADLGAASVGAPHIRQRLFFVAVADDERLERIGVQLRARRSRQDQLEAGRSEPSLRLADDENAGRAEGSSSGGGAPGTNGTRSADGRELLGLANNNNTGPQERSQSDGRRGSLRHEGPPSGADELPLGLGHPGGGGGGWDAGAVPLEEGESGIEGVQAWRVPHELVPPGATSGPWADAVWWYCRDGKIRPAQPGAFPLVAGSPSRVGRLRAYGNAIVPEVAAQFIGSVINLLTDAR
jgi:DNA (cytosine-5)-methyltransferase 1